MHKINRATRAGYRRAAARRWRSPWNARPGEASGTRQGVQQGAGVIRHAGVLETAPPAPESGRRRSCRDDHPEFFRQRTAPRRQASCAAPRPGDTGQRRALALLRAIHFQAAGGDILACCSSPSSNRFRQPEYSHTKSQEHQEKTFRQMVELGVEFMLPFTCVRHKRPAAPESLYVWFVYGVRFYTMVYLLMLPYFLGACGAWRSYRRGFPPAFRRYDAATRARRAPTSRRRSGNSGCMPSAWAKSAWRWISSGALQRPRRVALHLTTYDFHRPRAGAHLDARDVLLYYGPTSRP